MKLRTLLLMAVLVCSVALSGCPSDETVSPTAPPPAPEPPPPPMMSPLLLGLICDIGRCENSSDKKAACVAAISSCLEANPGDNDCLGYGVLICGDDGLGDIDDPGDLDDPGGPL